MKNLEEIIEITDNSITGFSILERKNRTKHDSVKLSNTVFNKMVKVVIMKLYLI